MKQENFSRAEARAKLGRQVRSSVEFSGIPKGTAGRVVQIEEIEPGDFEVVIEWKLPKRQPALCYWLTKKHYRQFLFEDENEGERCSSV
jgi:hypothetical protein